MKNRVAYKKIKCVLGFVIGLFQFYFIFDAHFNSMMHSHQTRQPAIQGFKENSHGAIQNVTTASRAQINEIFVAYGIVPLVIVIRSVLSFLS